MSDPPVLTGSALRFLKKVNPLKTPFYLTQVIELPEFHYFDAIDKKIVLHFRIKDYLIRVTLINKEKHPDSYIEYKGMEISETQLLPKWLNTKLRHVFQVIYEAVSMRDGFIDLFESRYECNNCEKKIKREQAILATYEYYFRPIFEFCSEACMDDFQKKYYVTLTTF